MSVFSNSSSSSRSEASQYVTAVLGLLGSADPQDVMSRTVPALRQISAGCSPQQLGTPEAAGKWSMRQVIQHLADSELVGGYRFRMILAHDRPAITGYDQDLWATRLHYDAADVEAALSEFDVLRRANLRLLDRATPADFDRVGVHAERGEESLRHLTRLYAGHDLLHLRQLERIRRAIRA